MTPHRLFTLSARAEAVTWTLLIGALIVRALNDVDSLIVTAAGGAHGLVFLVYGVTAALIGVNERWPLGRTVIGIVLAIVPYATIPFERFVSRRGLVRSAWRTSPTADSRDQHWFDRLFRWFIARPVLLVATLLAVIVTIFVVLLSLGPPTEWFN